MQNIVETFFGTALILGVGIVFFLMFAAHRSGTYAPPVKNSSIVKRTPEQIEKPAGLRLQEQLTERDNRARAEIAKFYDVPPSYWGDPRERIETVDGELVDEPQLDAGKYRGYDYNTSQLPPRSPQRERLLPQSKRSHELLGGG